MVASKSFIPQSEMNDSIYRFISFDSLIEMIVNEQLALVKTVKWDDPFENYFFNCQVLKDGEELDVKEISTRMYGQCWSLLPESDALWRIYSSDKKGVRIKTTLAKLFEVVNTLSPDTNAEAYDSIWMGKVEYKTSDAISQYFNMQKYMSHVVTSEFMIQSMLLKRKEFEHENEVRVIYGADRGFDREVKIYAITVNDFISEVTLDPRIDKRMESVYTKALLRLGFNGSITKSNLYSFEPQIINLS